MTTRQLQNVNHSKLLQCPMELQKLTVKYLWLKEVGDPAEPNTAIMAVGNRGDSSQHHAVPTEEAERQETFGEV
ncbi:hypothetical protein BGZ72_010511 [Mortierella alpina]|nr:hypothetical protein BGZ72_010511 [Mortierella alpina]